MKSPQILPLFLALFLLTGCGSALRSRSEPQAMNEGYKSYEGEAARTQSEGLSKRSEVSLNQADQSQSVSDTLQRKILRNGELTLEVSDPADVQRKIASITGSLGGFVVTSESKVRQIGDAKQELEVNLVVRIPAAQFETAMDQIRSTGNRVIQEKMSGQDVTEEFIDLEARIKTQKALEAQFLEIMKRASKVEDALEVQRQIAEVRTEIEKLAGRRRFLEDRASLSTITIQLQTPSAIAVNPSGFGRNIRQAVVDSIDVAVAIVLFLIRFVIVMIPVFILVILPGWLIGRVLFRRLRKIKLGRNQKSPASAETQLDSENT